MASISFLYPNYLWLLLLIPAFIFIYFFSVGYNKKKAFVFANFEALERFYGLEFFSKNFVALYMNVAVVLLLVLSLCGMSVNFVATTASHSYVLLIDNSGSMAATDFSPNRFIVAKESAKDFVNSLPAGVFVGVVGFSGEAIIYQEITTSKLQVSQGIDRIEFGDVGGTNIYNAIITADRMFDNLDSDKSRSVILMSDGQVNVGEAPQILALAERNNIVINTIAVGTTEGGLTQFNTLSKADTNFLRSLSFNTGGTFFQIGNENDLDRTFQDLVTPIEDEIEVNISLYLLIAAILIFTINWILFNLRIKTFP